MRPLTAYELDYVLQCQQAEKEGREIKDCDGLDPQKKMPCSKIHGHSGPCYWRGMAL